MIIVSVADFLLFFLLTSFGMFPPVVQVTSLFFGVGCLIGYQLLYVRQSWHQIIADRNMLIRYLVLGALLIAIRGSLISICTPLFSSHPIFSFIPAMIITVASGLLVTKVRSFQFELLLLAIGITFVRLLHLGTIELLPEEGYYWNYAVHPALGYIDHPPMVGWIIALGTSIFGVHEFGVRIVGFFFSLLTVVGVGELHRRVLGKEGLYVTLAVCLLAPYLCGIGLFTSPDTVLALSWGAAIFNLYGALIESLPRRWYWVGFWVGIGMLSKYSIALLALPTILFCAIDKNSRVWFSKKEPYAALIIAASLFSPVIIWNATNGWASFAFQSTGRVAEASTQFALHELIFDMSLLYLPTTLIIIWKLLPYLRGVQLQDTLESYDESKRKFFFSALFFLAPLLIFVLYSFRHETKLNWTGPTFLSMLPWVGYWLATKSSVQFQKMALGIAASFVILFSIIFQYLSFGLPLIPYGSSLHRILGWKAVTQAVLAQANNITVIDGKAPVIAGVDKHFIASNLSFYADSFNPNMINWGGYEFASRNILGEDALMWSRWSHASNFKGRTILMVARNINDLSDDRLDDKFTSLEPTQELVLYTREKLTRTYYTRIGRELK